MLVVDEWLHERAPAVQVADVLRCAWRGDLGAIGTPLPDECFDLVWVDDGSMWLSGPETTSWPRGYSLGSNAVGVRFRPGAGPALLGIAASEVRDTRVSLDELWSARDAREASDRVAGQADNIARMKELERVVGRLATNARPVDHLALAVAHEVGRVHPSPVHGVARSTGVSERQIRRRCREAFGYGPAVLARMLRLQRTLRLARSRQRPSRLADLAVAAGYFDQQHLAHEVRAIAGTTPSALLAVAGRASRGRGVRSIQDTPRRGADDDEGEEVS
jgi:AraC-like DNA-binding protein